MDFAKLMELKAQEYGIILNDRQLEQFNIYYELLLEWNKKINLTAITEPEEVAVKHMVDSLSAWDESLLPANARAIDVGTGAGFPSIPLKIMLPDLKLTLLDSLNKRIKFLQLVTDALGLKDVKLVHGRAEEVARQKKYREKYTIAFSRAVAKMSVLSEYTLPFVKIGGYLVALKGRQYKEEIEQANNALQVLGSSIEKVKPVKLPGIDDIRAIIYVHKEKQTPAVYPRKAGTPERNPL
ncbi:16S rRNA (guanine(527)-N(7))-methyltransferase RsmG [Pectinatus brassicae]|uniref:Ribosomal RNA small subunit methyltransferase G n=1 Tax=Pectinatus brassicae TaxID=862415 RepID=A0A840UII9_9FIRM|nr:16S rRNA (guanine(527)-N(7))-methyltransferase RsmG [Pectinatus brassicae]MBB5336926.1 16S rRNA (guanine527-N7)-methyltransferase [Pectinatus brassicae]